MVAKEGQPVSENDFLTGSISDWFGGNIPTTTRVLGRSSVVQGETIVNARLYGKPVPEFNANFKGVNIKTNDSKISNWAVTDSQMKIVYTDEWETMKDTADDRVIYFVVDRPTPPQPIPTPGGDGDWANAMMFVDESETFDPTNIDDCLSKYAIQFVKYTRDGVDYYLTTAFGSSPSAEVREEASKTDQIALNFSDQPESARILMETYYVKDGYLKINEFIKSFNSDDDVYEYINNYYISRFGEDGDQPNTSNPIPEDFDTWEIDDEEADSLPITNETNDYVYCEGDEEAEIPSMKMFKNMETFIQWNPGEPS